MDGRKNTECMCIEQPAHREKRTHLDGPPGRAAGGWQAVAAAAAHTLCGAHPGGAQPPPDLARAAVV